MKFHHITNFELLEIMFAKLNIPGLFYLAKGSLDELRPLFISHNLQPSAMLQAYHHGIFPWYDANSPFILWWSPPTRCVIPTADVHISRSLKKTIRQKNYQLTFDQAFMPVVEYCATVHGSSWIDQRMKKACEKLHQQGRMHSCELWENGTLIGGLYGLLLKRVFCAESMFSLRPSASKIALVAICQHLQKSGVPILEAQFMTDHLRTMGAIEISRDEYFQYLG